MVIVGAGKSTDMSSSGGSSAFGDNKGGGYVTTSTFFDPLLFLPPLFPVLSPDRELDLCLDDD